MSNEQTYTLTEDESRIIKAFKDIGLKGLALAFHRQFCNTETYLAV